MKLSRYRTKKRIERTFQVDSNMNAVELWLSLNGHVNFPQIIQSRAVFRQIVQLSGVNATLNHKRHIEFPLFAQDAQ